MRVVPDRIRLVTIVFGAAIALVVTGCAPPTAPEPTTPDSATSESATPAASSPASASAGQPSAASSSASPSKALPKVDLGTVTNTKATEKSGKGSAELVLHRKGKSFGIVVQVDCSECKGPFELTAARRGTPFGRSTAPLKGAYLVNIDKKQRDRQTLQLTATGSWKIVVLSWNRLPLVNGEQSGKGSDVLYLSDRASKLRVKAKPSGKNDSFAARVFTESDRPRIFGNDEAFTETIDKVDLPGVIAITTNGTWTITPKR